MYGAFYGLKEKPFNSTPDPKFLFMSAGHREALAHLVFGVQEQKGFIILTGEVGTGKTTLLNALFRRLDADTAVAFVSNTTLSFDEMLQFILRDFGVKDAGTSRGERLMALSAYLAERRSGGLNSVIVFDEAQNLQADVLEQIRLLSNFETATDKLLQIALVGQPELKTRLRLPELRQLRQRIALRAHLEPLSAEDTSEYIKSRLRIAGATDLRIFDEPAVRRIADYSQGIPRVINMVCDHCLVSGYALRKRRIGKDAVERAIKYFEASERPPKRWRWKATAGWALGTVAASTIGLALLSVSDAYGVISRDITAPILALARTAKALLLP